MTEEEKISFLEEIMDVEEGELSPQSSLIEIEEWDSLSVLSLIMEMKTRYGIELSNDEIKSFKTVGDICDRIPDKG